jgi:alkylated DNA repair dioxygenase AlkB
MIQGLSYRTNAISEEEEKRLLCLFDEKGQWLPITDSPNSRRVQHYGFRYDYRSGRVTDTTTEISSEWFDFFPEAKELGMNQVIVNEYCPGQGISAHTDSAVYGGTILCYTIGSGATMRFTYNERKMDVYVGPRSLYIMEGEARYVWKHEMIGRKSDIVNGKRVARGRRLSVTFRFVPVPVQ